jgi:hypothetical protein
VTIRRGYIDPAGFKGLAIDGMTSWEWTGPVQDAGQVLVTDPGSGPQRILNRETPEGGPSQAQQPPSMLPAEPPITTMSPPCHLRSDAE